MRRNLLCISKMVLQKHHAKAVPLARYLSSKEAVERRHHLFNLEKKRQIEKVGRIEKIEVQYKGVPDNCTLVMNKDISTPYDCARHLSEEHTTSSALALLDGTVPWDMHRPLTENCTLELQTFTCPEPQQLNKAFWRSASFMLGAVVSSAFKDNVPVKLHSFPGPDIRSGSFIYDVELPTLPEWKPTHQELLTLGAEFVKLSREKLPFERLEVGEELAKEMFVDNEHKAGQIPSIVKSNGKVTLYRIGKHIDISKGPMISNTGQFGRINVTAVHILRSSKRSNKSLQLYRFQGVALPYGAVLDHFTFNILVDRAKKLNPARSPLNGHYKENRTEKQDSVAATA